MTLFEFLYFLGYSVKRHYALKNQKRLPCKVISIGNITLGGTGKTPATIALAEEAKQRGFRPCILTRGYKGKAQGPCFVSTGEGPILDENQAGDEAVLMAEKLKGIPVVKGKNRYEAGIFALSSLPSALCPDLFILDDGFQHWSLFRDKDILFINSAAPFGNRRLLPLGILREPISEIKRADIIVITNMHTNQSYIYPSPSIRLSPPQAEKDKGGGVSLAAEIKKYNPEAPIFSAGHRPSNFISTDRDIFTLEWAKDKTFFGFCGIGNPQSFKKTLLSAGATLTGLKTFRDHYRYGANDIRLIVSDAERNNSEWIVTTEKDIMRLKGLELPENIVALAVEFVIEEGFYEAVFRF